MRHIRRAWGWLTKTGPIPTTPWLSWLFHAGATVAGGAFLYHLLAWLFGLTIGWLIGVWMCAAFYQRKEVLDAAKYIAGGILFRSQRGAGIEGATNLEDGVADAGFPLMLAIGSTVQWVITGRPW